MASANVKLVPFVLSVTGHRDLRPEDCEPIERALNSLFEDLRQKYPNTPLLVISQLAEGADRLVARSALTQGAALMALLPMSRAEYERDFQSAESRAEFAELVSQAQAVVELSEPPGAPPTSESQVDARRSLQYALAGAAMVQQCQLLLALWTGQPSKKLGGTSDVVRYQLEGLPPLLAPRHSQLDPPETGPVIHILTPRQSHPEINGTPGEIGELFPPSNDEHVLRDRIETSLKRLDGLNRDLSRAQFPHRYENALSASADPHETSADKLRRDFNAVDYLANRFQRLSIRSLVSILALAAVGALGLQLRSIVPQRADWFMWIYIAAFVGAYGVYLWAKWARLQSKHLDYRALAEGLRVQHFWSLAGLEDSAADHYLQRQKGELSWIREALRACHLTCDRRSAQVMATSDERQQRLQGVRHEWIQDQRDFFQRTARRNEQMARRLGAASKWLLRVGLALAAVNALLVPGGAALVVLTGMAPVAAALLHVYNRHRALAEDARRYASMSDLWSTADQVIERLLAVGDVPACLDVVRELGQETLAENGEWLLLHRQRPLEVPAIK
jgi:hypothetical protein